MAVTVLVLLGSLRVDSTNRKLAEAVAEHAPDGVEVVIHEGLRELPFYDEDIEAVGETPATVAGLRRAAAAADAVLVVTPEYNGTLPAVVKNAIDWLSRPYGAGSITGTPAAAVGTSMGQYGGVWAQDHARLALGIAGAAVLEEPKLAIGHVHRRFDGKHPREDAEVIAGAEAVLTALAAAVEATRAGQPIG